MADQPVTFANTLAVTGVTTLTGGVNTGTIHDNTTGAPQATLLTAGITVNNLLTLSSSLALNTGGTAFPNGTAGSATLYQFMVGTLKLVIVTESAWGKSTAGDSNVTFPTTFSQWAIGIAFGSGPFHVNTSGGANQIVNTISGFPASAGLAGSVFSTTAGANNNNVFEIQATNIGQIGLYGSQTGPLNGIIFMIGV